MFFSMGWKQNQETHRPNAPELTERVKSLLLPSATYLRSYVHTYIRTYVATCLRICVIGVCALEHGLQFAKIRAESVVDMMVPTPPTPHNFPLPPGVLPPPIAT